MCAEHYPQQQRPSDLVILIKGATQRQVARRSLGGACIPAQTISQTRSGFLGSDSFARRGYARHRARKRLQHVRMSRPIKTEASFDIPFPPGAVWDVFSKTDWLNRAAGLPPVSYRVQSLPEGGTRVMANSKFFGLPLTWEEKPFEWVEPEFYQVERFFERGPLERISGGMQFSGNHNSTRLRIFAEFHPRNLVGSIVARLFLARSATSGMDEIVRHVTDFLQGTEKTCLPNLERTSLNEAAFASGLTRLNSEFAEKSLVSLLEHFLRESPDVELARIRPIAVARKWKQDSWAVLHLFLQATRAGLLDLSWEVLCPNCRSSRQPLTRSLADVSKTVHCEACQIKFDAQFDKSVELKFTVNSNIKICEQATFCLAGPNSKAHIVTQLIIPPKTTRAIPLPGSLDGLRLRSPQVRDVLPAEDFEPARAMVCTADRFAFEANEQPGGNLRIRNPNAHPVVVALERVAWSDEILTASRVTNLQEFRDLFAREVVSASEQITVGQQIILFTDLRGSTAIYCGIGDASAYALVRDHFRLLHDIIAEHHGSIVKTIGDAVMGCFSNPGEALGAVRKMHLELSRGNSSSAVPDRPQLKLKSSLHIGSCLAVNANDRLDYFGTTVNLAARLVDCCQGGDLTLSDEFYRRPEARDFIHSHNFSAEPAELQLRRFAVPARVWRIGIVDSRNSPPNHPP